MTIIRSIHPASAFKVGFIVCGLLGFVLGVFCTAVSLAGAAFLRQAHISLFGLTGSYIGYFAVIVCPVVYGLIGGVAAAVGAFIYNLASAWIGGIEIDLA